MNASRRKARMLKNLRPPDEELCRFSPKLLVRPLRVKYVYRVPGSPDRLALRAVILLELVARNDVPRGTVVSEVA